jgi:hypothetical protein
MLSQTLKSNQKQCCYRAALNQSNGYCTECGGPLLRCIAFEECGGLLSQAGHCEVCVAPRLLLTPDSVLETTVGGTLVLNLELQNMASVPRPLFVKSVRAREQQGDWQSVDLPWDRLEAGTSAPFSVKADELKKAGTHEVELLIAVASRFQWREEVVAFSGRITIQVEDAKPVSVQQNIYNTAGESQTGVTIVPTLRINNQDQRRETSSNTTPSEIALTRASVLETQFGLRGTGGNRVRRDARFSWVGFEPGNSPASGPIVAADSLVKFGRSRTQLQNGPNDVRLLAFADGTVDEETSRSISRHHFNVYIENDRLMLQAIGAAVRIDDFTLPRGEAKELAPNCLVHPSLTSPDAVSLQFEFEAQHEEVTSIRVSRLGAK